MSVTRNATLDTTVAHCGRETLHIDEPRKAWSARGYVTLPTGICLVDLYVGTVGRSHRGRCHVERRFQNPGKGHPIRARRGHLPLLIGLWDGEGGDPILLGMDALRRIGLETRHSLFVPLRTLRQAQRTGWEEHINAKGEQLIAFAPAMLPRYTELRLQECQAAEGIEWE